MTAKSPTQRILVLLAALALIVGLASAANWRSFAVTRKVLLPIVATIASGTHSHGIVARRDWGVSAAADLRGKTSVALVLAMKTV